MSDNPEKTHEELRRALLRLEAEGKADEVLQMIRSSFGAPEDRQGMTDASKRLRQADLGEWELTSATPSGSQASGYSAAAGASALQLPTRSSTTTSGLPRGVDSVSRWGDTLCELPKVANKRPTYKELVQEAYEDPEMMGYLTRFVLKHNGPSPKGQDLRRYLEHIRFSRRESAPSYLGESSVIRNYKE